MKWQEKMGLRFDELSVTLYRSCMIDSHCHLADKQFDADLGAVIGRANEAGVTQMITIADTIAEGEKCIEIARRYDQVFCTVGVHPHEAKQWKRGDGDRIRSLVASSNKVKAVGEIGLDYHYNHSPQADQRAVFLEQLSLAHELSMPAVVHCRNAVEDVRTIVDEVEPLQLVIHCCTEKWSDVSWAVECGYFLSFTGIATYPASHDIRDTIKHCPLQQMMIETDCPYLAPVPHRGKRNEPAFVTEVLKEVAKIKDISIEEADRITTKNTIEFFQLLS